MKPLPVAQHKVSMISLGCPRTLVDSELYLGKLKQSGYQVVDEPSGSDVVIINTCSFVQDSIKESIDTVLQAVKLKQQGKVKAVVVAGCLVQRFKQDLVKELPDVDGFIGVDGFGDVDTVVNKALSGEHAESYRPKPNVPHQGRRLARSPLTPSHYAYLKISEGCLKGCSFCVIPKIKGPLSSRSIEDVVDEAKQLIDERGVKELIVVGQDTSDYGVDLYGKPQIAQLLSKLGALSGIRWIRLLYCHPHGISRELIETIRDVPSICKYLDMAIEHADDAVLKRMNRIVNQARLRNVISELRRQIPGVALRTSIIVGFPGETESAFQNLLNFLKDAAFERLGAFTYSHEEGSASFRYPDQVPEAIRQERFDELMRLQQTIAQQITAKSIGQRYEVIIDEKDHADASQYLGRTRADCPEVDGVVFVHSKNRLQSGDFATVEITDHLEYDLVGRAVNQS